MCVCISPCVNSACMGHTCITMCSQLLFNTIWSHFPKNNRLEALNSKMIEIGKQGGPLAALQKAPIVAQMAGLVLAIFLGPTMKGGSVDMDPEQEAAVVY